MARSHRTTDIEMEKVEGAESPKEANGGEALEATLDNATLTPEEQPPAEGN